MIHLINKLTCTESKSVSVLDRVCVCVRVYLHACVCVNSDHVLILDQRRSSGLTQSLGGLFSSLIDVSATCLQCCHSYILYRLFSLFVHIVQVMMTTCQTMKVTQRIMILTTKSLCLMDGKKEL